MEDNERQRQQGNPLSRKGLERQLAKSLQRSHRVTTRQSRYNNNNNNELLLEERTFPLIELNKIVVG